MDYICWMIKLQTEQLGGRQVIANNSHFICRVMKPQTKLFDGLKMVLGSTVPLYTREQHSTCLARCYSNAIKGFGFPHWKPVGFQMRWSNAQSNKWHQSQVHGFESQEHHVGGGIVGVISAALPMQTALDMPYGARFECHKRLWSQPHSSWSKAQTNRRAYQLHFLEPTPQEFS